VLATDRPIDYAIWIFFVLAEFSYGGVGKLCKATDPRQGRRVDRVSGEWMGLLQARHMQPIWS